MRIFNGCYTAIEGIQNFAINIRFAWEKTRVLKPLRRHAELTVNLSGTLSVFMLETLESQLKD
ncbi:MAG: hypothetical protein IPL24_05920 [Bacteroidetes bacterium]|nr:hypothetical protein [Bacteroidota bacterium]